jgi:hypothetical protein
MWSVDDINMDKSGNVARATTKMQFQHD